MEPETLIQSRMDFIDNQLDYLPCSISNIKSHLPKLLDTQHEDVLRIEKCFQDKKGYLLTNGTGTGKTYVGLGVIARFLAQEKTNIIIIVPTDAKCNDWIKEGARLNIDIYKLENIMDKGRDVRVTTYANFYQNNRISNVIMDLIVYDESHYLNQNQKGAHTSCLSKHYIMANVPSEARAKATSKIGPAPRLPKDLRDLYQKEKYDEAKRQWNKNHFDYYISLYQRTKVLYMSATPFAYHKSIKYIDGTILEMSEHVIEPKGYYPRYNEPIGFEKFLVKTFGYVMKNNKCQIPPPEVDQGLLERAFFEKLVEMGVASTRVIDLDVDYSRDFYKIDSDIGDKIDEGLKLLRSEEFGKRYKVLGEYGYKNFRYLRMNQMLESIKSQRIEERLNAHLFLERKIVIFHTYNHADIESPFLFDHQDLEVPIHLGRSLTKEIHRFNEEYADLVNMDLSELINVRDTIKNIFPKALEFNGTIPKKKRSEYIKMFNDPDSGYDVLIVQTKAGREGISLHDLSGDVQRVMMDLGLPVAPTQAIQQEGRIYRYGTLSNAIYEYITLQTAFERSAFAFKIAQRAKTAENLAMGNLARDLEKAFKDGYMNYKEALPNIWQGRGSKETDRVLIEISEWDKAKTFYFQRQKANSKRRTGGIDFFATPEPLGMKMIEWLDAKPGEKLLEPSSGQGSISRFFLPTTENVMIEPHLESSSICEINSYGKVIAQRFESYNIINKFDGVVMNPPFGHAGKTAMEHVDKAAKHLDQKGGVLYAIIPMGSSMEKRFNAWLEDPKTEKSYRLYYAGELLLPACTFERAGTKTMTRIIKIIKWGWNAKNKFDLNTPEEIYPKTIDLTYCEKIGELFEAIEEIKF